MSKGALEPSRSGQGLRVLCPVVAHACHTSADSQTFMRHVGGWTGEGRGGRMGGQMDDWPGTHHLRAQPQNKVQPRVSVWVGVRGEAGDRRAVSPRSVFRGPTVGTEWGRKALCLSGAPEGSQSSAPGASRAQSHSLGYKSPRSLLLSRHTSPVPLTGCLALCLQVPRPFPLGLVSTEMWRKTPQGFVTPHPSPRPNPTKAPASPPPGSPCPAFSVASSQLGAGSLILMLVTSHICFPAYEALSGPSRSPSRTAAWEVSGMEITEGN